MKIGVISDSHNSTVILRAALAAFHREGISTLLHCGDMTSPETAALLGEFRVIHAVGNGDYASGEIRKILLQQNPLSFSGLVFTGDIGGVPLAVTHGHQRGEVQQLARTSLYRYVFCGHSHRHSDDAFGACRVINPGALGGNKYEERSALVLDLATGQAQFFNP